MWRLRAWLTRFLDVAGMTTGFLGLIHEGLKDRPDAGVLAVWLAVFLGPTGAGAIQTRLGGGSSPPQPESSPSPPHSSSSPPT